MYDMYKMYLMNRYNIERLYLWDFEIYMLNNSSFFSDENHPYGQVYGISISNIKFE